jgi:hypothetical protein
MTEPRCNCPGASVTTSAYTAFPASSLSLPMLSLVLQEPHPSTNATECCTSF